MKRQQGFTMIELIMVIVILGILAAVALPRFVNIGYDARVAAVKALQGSMRSTNAIIYAKSNVANNMSASSSIAIDDVTVSTAYGYAANVVSGIAPLLNLSTEDYVISTSAIAHIGAASNVDCRVTYTPPANSKAAPTYVLVTSGC